LRLSVLCLRYPDPFLALSAHKHHFVLSRGQEVADDEIVLVSVEGLVAFVQKD
jgi:hypothetical protein